MGLTVREALADARDVLAFYGVPEPEADAQVLLARVLGVDRLRMTILDQDRLVLPQEEGQFRAYVQARAQRQPLQYILLEQEFWSMTFHVDPNVLIPRGETEIVVEAVLETIGPRKRYDTLSMLDLGTGSGILAVVLAKNFRGARIFAVDISEKALTVAEQNVRRHGMAEAVTLLSGDLFFPLAEKKGYFDAIVSNPPYIPSRILGELTPEVRDYEPHLALDGGPDGLCMIRRIIDQSPLYLTDGGWLFLEIGSDQAARVAEDCTRHPMFADFKVIRDYCGLERVIRVKKVGHGQHNH